ncbi:hypothetical protein M3J09_002625 [Ascochyta lentis]
MSLASGPYDGRKARRKRCDYCAKRHIKCQGGFPCRICKEKNRFCHMTREDKTIASVFVHTTSTTFTNRSRSHRKATPISLTHPMVPCRNDIYLTYFFASFLRLNAFTGIAPEFQTSVSSLVHYSSELRDAINAISALHITQNNQTCQSVDMSNENLAALQAYSRSVRSMQVKIASKEFIDDPSALWTTLLLSVFELMRDTSGTNWLAHFLHGTSTILRLQGPSILTLSGIKNEQHRAFFFSARIFEIARALIYTEPTFLSTPEWMLSIEQYRTQSIDVWTPKETLFDILPQFVDLGRQNLHFVSHVQDMSLQTQHHIATSLAQTGLTLQSSLVQWYSDSTFWPSPSAEENVLDAEMSIAYAYYHTISIYLDGIFSYHTPFRCASAPNSPILNRTEIDAHLEQILTTSHELLNQGSAGILLFFPLRVAGARARDAATQSEILRLLQIIMRRGFAVAQSFVEDLTDLWARQQDALELTIHTPDPCIVILET